VVFLFSFFFFAAVNKYIDLISHHFSLNL